MCEGIARLGNGICLMAVGAESIVAKTSKLLRASRTHALKNISVDWGTNFTASTDVTMQTDVFRQAPEQITQIIAGNRFVVFTLAKHSDFVVPENIVVKGQLDGKGEVLSFDVPVTRLSQTTNEKNHTHLIHTLAARRIIRELDDQDKSKDDVKTKEMMIYLGEQYQLANRYTSFVAVEERLNTKTQADDATATEAADNDDEGDGELVVVEVEDVLTLSTEYDLSDLLSKLRSGPQGVRVGQKFKRSSALQALPPLPPSSLSLNSPGSAMPTLDASINDVFSILSAGNISSSQESEFLPMIDTAEELTPRGTGTGMSAPYGKGLNQKAGMSLSPLARARPSSSPSFNPVIKKRTRPPGAPAVSFDLIRLLCS
jgi:hypothetical protein